jgi:Carboxypeptidase regulatory-like domain
VDASGTVAPSVITGPDGAFVFDDLTEGTYTLTASGYAPVAQMVQVTPGTEASAVVQLGNPAANSATNGNVPVVAAEVTTRA